MKNVCDELLGNNVIIARRIACQDCTARRLLVVLGSRPYRDVRRMTKRAPLLHDDEQGI